MLLTEEQTLIRHTARAFAQEKVAPHVRAWEAAGEIPRALLAEMGELGFMGMCVPAEWGGGAGPAPRRPFRRDGRARFPGHVWSPRMGRRRSRHGVLRAGAGGDRGGR